MASIVMVYGALVAVLSYLNPEVGKTAHVGGMIGGALSTVWGAIALAGGKRRWLIGLTLAAVAFLLLVETVSAWMPPAGGPGSGGRYWLALLLGMSVATLIYVMHGERAAEFYQVPPRSS